jgi:MSHA biogenesis protein MshN
LLARSGLNEQAVTAYEQALRTRPDNPTWWLGLGVALDAQGNKATAIEAYTRARTLGTLRPDLQAWLSQKLTASN